MLRLVGAIAISGFLYSIPGHFCDEAVTRLDQPETVSKAAIAGWRWLGPYQTATYQRPPPAENLLRALKQDQT